MSGQRSELPPLSPELDSLLVEFRARQRRARDSRRSEFAAQLESTIPPLEFLTPECSVCGLSTECDGDTFWCVECRISWGQNGEDPERWPREDEASV